MSLATPLKNGTTNTTRVESSGEVEGCIDELPNLISRINSPSRNMGSYPMGRYDKAVDWMEKNNPNNEELIRFRAEAAELLGIPRSEPSSSQSASQSAIGITNEQEKGEAAIEPME